MAATRTARRTDGSIENKFRASNIGYLTNQSILPTTSCVMTARLSDAACIKKIGRTFINTKSTVAAIITIKAARLNDLIEGSRPGMSHAIAAKTQNTMAAGW